MRVGFYLAALLCVTVFILLRPELSPTLNAHVEIDQVTPASRATVIATQSGNWSDAGIWDAGAPQRSARVWIPKGISVTVDAEFAEPYEWVRVDGLLRFAPDINTSLNVETLAIEHDGRLEIGTAREPVTARAVLTFDHRGGPIDHLDDPLEFSRGLLATGIVEIHGQPKTSWVSVSDLPEAGAVWISLDRVPAGWAEGDTVVLTSPDYGGNETFQLLSVDATGVRLDRPVRHHRQFPVDPKTGQPYADLTLHLGNLTRNVVIRTHPNYAGQTALQGHVMLMHRGGHSLKYAAFENLGRTTIDPVTDPLVGPGGTRDPSLCPPDITTENVRGRYALHFHMASPHSEQSVVEGNAVSVRRGSRLKIGYINHSSNVVFKENVGVNIDGSTFFTEEGDEVGAFIENLAIYSGGSDTPTDEQPRDIGPKKNCPDVYNRRRLDVGHKGHGFWIHGGGTDVIGNVAAEHAASGFNIWSRPLDHRLNNTFRVQFPVALLPGGGSWAGQEMLSIEFIPFVFRGNISYVLGHGKNGSVGGFEVNYHSLQQAKRHPAAPKNLFSDNLAWNVKRGVVTSYAGWTEYERLRLIRGDLFGSEERPDTVGMILSHQGGNHNLVRGIVVEGFKTGIRPSSQSIYEDIVVDGSHYLPPVADTAPGPESEPQPGPRPRR